jgi:ABC-2 type transport system ATP-binding protein
MGFTNALWSGAEVLNKESDEDVNTFTIRLINNITPNQMLQLVLPTCEIISFQEIIPSMNDIFIMKVNQNNNSIGTQSNYTE